MGRQCSQLQRNAIGLAVCSRIDIVIVTSHLFVCVLTCVSLSVVHLFSNFFVTFLCLYLNVCIIITFLIVFVFELFSYYKKYLYDE